MKYAHVEEILEAFIPLWGLCCAYSCPGMDPKGGKNATTSGNPDHISTWVMDVKGVFDQLRPLERQILFCLYGNLDSLRRTSKRVKKHPELVKRLRDQGLAKMSEGLKLRKITLPTEIVMKYVI